MRIGISANPNKPFAVALARRALERLQPHADVVLTDETHALVGLDVPHTPIEALEADAVVAIGGDGTFLYTLKRTAVPLLPINAGTVGFLAEVDGANAVAFDGALDRLLRGLFYIESRMKLACEVGGENLSDATNEVVVHTSQVAKMRLFELTLDGRPVGRLRADGLIVATPTGSTSYSLSALGPILDPSVEGIVVTALAPFQSTQRAVVVDPLKSVRVRLVHPDKEGFVVIDGQEEHRLPGGTSVLVYRSPRKAEFLRFGSGFFRRLQGKKILPWTEELEDAEANDDAHLPTAP